MNQKVSEFDSYLEEGTLKYEGWAQALRDEEMILGQRCGDCNRLFATPRAACSYCGSRNFQVERIPETGEVYSETTIAIPPVGFEEDYQVVLVALGDARILGRLKGNRKIEIGDRVTLSGVDEVDVNPIPVFSPR